MVFAWAALHMGMDGHSLVWAWGGMIMGSTGYSLVCAWAGQYIGFSVLGMVWEWPGMSLAWDDLAKGWSGHILLWVWSVCPCSALPILCAWIELGWAGQSSPWPPQTLVNKAQAKAGQYIIKPNTWLDQTMLRPGHIHPRSWTAQVMSNKDPWPAEPITGPDIG
jgi:hypothetical protein